MKQIIFERTLADYTIKLLSAFEEGYRVSETLEDYPLFVNNGFYAGLVKDDAEVIVSKEVSEDIVSAKSDADDTTESGNSTETKSEATTETQEDKQATSRRGRKPSNNV
jgi:hypothetical protein